MKDNFIIQRAEPNDAEELYDLYINYLTNSPPSDPPDFNKLRGLLEKFAIDLNYNLLTGKLDGKIISSVTLVIIENFTHGAQSYAVMENVVTHADFRNQGFASELIQYARKIAENAGCYKIMLLTGSKKESTLDFYKNNGFDPNEKKAFIIRF